MIPLQTSRCNLHSISGISEKSYIFTHSITQAVQHPRQIFPSDTCWIGTKTMQWRSWGEVTANLPLSWIPAAAWSESARPDLSPAAAFNLTPECTLDT